jgi:hypothetical protein
MIHLLHQVMQRFLILRFAYRIPLQELLQQEKTAPTVEVETK